MRRGLPWGCIQVKGHGRASACMGVAGTELPEERPSIGPLLSPLESLPDRTEGMAGLGSVCASTPSLLWPQEDSSFYGIRFLTKDL